ncbi:hypothetical protein NQ318_011870 [Aromia moschata]|uniref:Uncharacterized protein n=1 Tax=Aromia moschata TaxID=1265417 RepID=A0AAV8XIR4_9CUCU|nr:hypothetical protein NQ318_011870 [Aromia moschata]
MYRVVLKLFINLIIGIGVPLELKTPSVVFGWGFRAFYYMPANLSEVMPMDLNVRKRRSVSRWDIYKTLEKMSEIRRWKTKYKPVEKKSFAVERGPQQNSIFLQGGLHSLRAQGPVKYKSGADDDDRVQTITQVGPVANKLTLLRKKGLSGKPCILRSICEASDVPIDKHNGFIEELFHTLFTLLLRSSNHPLKYGVGPIPPYGNTNMSNSTGRHTVGDNGVLDSRLKENWFDTRLRFKEEGRHPIRDPIFD